MTAAHAIDLGSDSLPAQPGASPAGRVGADAGGPPPFDIRVGARTPLASWLPSSGLVELSGGPGAAHTSLAVSLVIHAQRQGEPVAWIEDAGQGGLYPPDLDAAGVDLAGLVVVRVPGGAQSARRASNAVRLGAPGLARAAELLLRSGGFGLVVIDLVGGSVQPGHGTDVWLGRLAGLARRHGARVVLLTAREARAGSLGPLVATRVGAERVRLAPGLHALTPAVWKDKGGRAGLAGPPATERRRAPWGAEGPTPSKPERPAPEENGPEARPDRRVA